MFADSHYHNIIQPVLYIVTAKVCVAFIVASFHRSQCCGGRILLAADREIAPRHSVIVKLGLVPKHNIFAAGTAAYSPHHRYLDKMLARRSRRLSWIPLSQDGSVANRSHRSRIMHATLALVPRRVLDLLQFLSDAQVWMNDYRWYDESELWRRQVCFLPGLNDTGANPRCSPHFLSFNLTRLRRYSFIFFGFRAVHSLNSPPLTSRRSFILNLLSDTH